MHTNTERERRTHKESERDRYLDRHKHRPWRWIYRHIQCC